MYYLHYTGKITSSLPSQFDKSSDLANLEIVYDTEFTTGKDNKLTIDSVQLYCPALNRDHALVYLDDDLDDGFNPFTAPLLAYGYDANVMGDDDYSEMVYEFRTVFEEVTEGQKAKDARLGFLLAVKNGDFDELLDKWGLEASSLVCKRIPKTEEVELIFELPKLQINFLAFFADVDLFKSFSKNYQHYILDAKLESRRVIKAGMRNTMVFNPLIVDGKLYELAVKLRDCMNRFPPSNRSLDNQCKIFKTDFKKLNIETEDLAKELGHNSAKEIKTNMTLFKNKKRDLFLQYAAQDCFATYALSQKQQEYSDVIRTDFDLEPVEVRDTTGSNVGKFLSDSYNLHFGAATEVKLRKIVTRQRNLGSANSLQKVELNRYGVQPFETVGGLLYSRVARYPVLKGKFGDLDESSCYATKLSNMNIYLGQPIITTFKQRKYKPALATVLEAVEEQKCPRDAWFVRVSGSLNQAVNTLILSDLTFSPKDERFKTIWDKNPNQRSIEEFNAYKLSDSEANSTLLTKEIKFGLINADLLDCLKLLPDSWQQEYLDLKVDALIFIPGNLICDSLDELEKVREEYELEEYTEAFDAKSGLLQINSVRAKCNVCLRYPIGEYFKKLKQKRSEYKKAGNPIQEVYKLFLNSGYGALACRHLAVNNLLAANQVTASARATSWMMNNALNGFQVITDGCTFSWEHVPVGQKFTEILASNPGYLIDFDPSIQSGLSEANYSQNWVNHGFRQHLYDFYSVDKKHVPANLYDFELKTETFTDSTGRSHETVVFTDFHNTGSGNYSKGMHGQHVLIDGSDYDFSEQHKKVKARSFKGENPELLAWYVDALEHGYSTSRVDVQTEILKLGEACKQAVKYLDQVDKIAFPCGFATQKFKLMKLITRSQFLFQSEKQLRNFERINQLGKLDVLSKRLLTTKYWQAVTLADLEPYGVSELRADIDYCEYNKNHPIGVGFELLCLSSKHKGSVGSVRNLIADTIRRGITDFNAALNIDRNLSLASNLQNLFAALVILRANEEADLRELLVNSADQPTVLSVTKENVRSLGELMDSDWDGD